MKSMFPSQNNIFQVPLECKAFLNYHLLPDRKIHLLSLPQDYLSPIFAVRKANIRGMAFQRSEKTLSSLPPLHKVVSMVLIVSFSRKLFR